MVLSPADFAAYSRATGTPYPETPEERAEKALEVREFRQNQLQQPSDRQSEAAALGLGIGLGLAGLGGAALALRKGRTIPKKTGGPRGGQSGIGFTDIPPPSSPPPGPAPTGGGGGSAFALPSQTKAGVFERVKRKFPDIPGEQELTRAYAPEARRAEEHAKKFGYADLNPAERKLVNLQTGEIYSRGRSPDVPTLVEAQDMVGDVQASIQSRDAVQSASDQADARFESVVQRDVDSVKYGKSAVVQEIAQEPARMVRRQGKLVPLNQLQEQAAQIAPPQVGLRQQDPNRFLRKAPSVSAEEINTFAGQFDVYGRPIPKAEQTLGLIGPQPRNVYSAETPGPAPANEAQIARRELARQAETLLEDIQTEEQAKGILFELAAQYDPQQALAAKRAELQAKGLKGQRLEKSLTAITGPDVRAALEDARLQPGLQTEGAPLKFSREVPNIGPEAVVTKTATGSAIRGAGRLLNEPPAQSRQRTLFGDYPDPLVTGQPVDSVPDRPGKENVLGQMISAPIPRIDKFVESQEGGGAGIGVYGRETDYVPGAVSKRTGEYSAAAQRKPTETTGFKTLSDLPTPYQGLSDQDLGQLTMLGSKADAYNAERELAKRRSFDVSRDIRRIQTSGRPDAQQLVKDYIKNLGFES